MAIDSGGLELPIVDDANGGRGEVRAAIEHLVAHDLALFVEGEIEADAAGSVDDVVEVALWGKALLEDLRLLNDRLRGGEGGKGECKDGGFHGVKRSCLDTRGAVGRKAQRGRGMLG